MAEFSITVATQERRTTYSGLATEDFVRELRLLYRLGTTFVGDNLITPANGAGPFITAPLDYTKAETFPLEQLRGTPGVITPPTIVPLPPANTGLDAGPAGHVYLRIWVVPVFLRPTNPQLNVDIPFIIWQAFNKQNNMSSITGSGQTGLTLDLSAPHSWAPLEQLTVNLQITPTAPNVVSAIYNFNFDD